MKEFRELGVEVGAPQILKCHYSFVEMSVKGLECNVVTLNYYH